MPRFTYAVLLALLTSASASAGEAPMRSLDYFQGSWHCHGRFPASGRVIDATMHFQDDLAGAALVKHHDDVAPSSYHAIESWGYDAHAKHFNAVVMDSFGSARRFSSAGWQQDTLTWASSADVRPRQQFVYVRLGPDRYRVDWKAAKPGKPLVVGDTLSCTRD